MSTRCVLKGQSCTKEQAVDDGWEFYKKVGTTTTTTTMACPSLGGLSALKWYWIINQNVANHRAWYNTLPETWWYGKSAEQAKSAVQCQAPPSYCGFATEKSYPYDGSQPLRLESVSETCSGSCWNSECASLAACDAKCNGCTNCGGYVYQPDGGGGYRCWLVGVVSGSTQYVNSYSAAPDDGQGVGWKLYVNSRSPACSPEGTTTPPVMCECINHDAGTWNMGSQWGKNGYACTDGTSGWCASAHQKCVPTSSFTKEAIGTGNVCKVMCGMAASGPWEKSDSYQCTDGFYGNCRVDTWAWNGVEVEKGTTSICMDSRP